VCDPVGPSTLVSSKSGNQSQSSQGLAVDDQHINPSMKGGQMLRPGIKLEELFLINLPQSH